MNSLQKLSRSMRVSILRSTYLTGGCSPGPHSAGHNRNAADGKDRVQDDFGTSVDVQCDNHRCGQDKNQEVQYHTDNWHR